MKKILFLLIFLIESIFIYAQEISSSEKKIYTKENLVDSLKLNNPEILKLQEEYNRAVLDVKDAKAGLWPSIDLQVAGIFMVNPPIGKISINCDDILNFDNLPSGWDIPSGEEIVLYDGMDRTLYNFSLSLTQPIFTWGKIKNAIKLYEEISEIKFSQLENQIGQMESELKIRLASLYYLKKINAIIDEEKVFADKMISYSEISEKTGMLLKQDVLEAKLKIKELEIARLDLNDQINTQLIELSRMVGLENLSLENLDLSIDEKEIISILEIGKIEIENKALSPSHGNMKILNQLVEVSKIAEKIAEGFIYWKPDIALKVDLGYAGFKFPFIQEGWKDKDDYSLNLTLGIQTTVWDGGKKLNDIARKNSEIKTAEINVLDAQGKIKKTIDSQLNTAEVSSIKVEYQDIKIDSALSKIKQQELLYSTGYGSETDVLSAKIDWCNQRIEKEKQLLNLVNACLMIKYLTE